MTKKLNSFLVFKFNCLTLGAAILLTLVGCDRHEEKSVTLEKEETQIIPSQSEKLITHFYSMKDGDEYGYEPALSEDQKRAGAIASNLVMIKFLGERKGHYQLLQSINEGVQIVFECDRPCSFLRARTFLNGIEQSKERIRRAEGSILFYAFEDAMAGELEQHYIMRKGKKLTLWFDE